MFYLTRPQRTVSTGSGADFSRIPGTGLLAVNKGHPHAAPAVEGPGISLINADMVGGKLTVSAEIQGRIAFGARVPCHQAAATPLPVNMKGIRYYRITHILFMNSTGVPDAGFRAGLYTMVDKGGEAVFPPTQSFAGAGLTDDLFATYEYALPTAMRGKRAVPFFYFVPEVVNPSQLYMDIQIRGEVLEWEIRT